MKFAKLSLSNLDSFCSLFVDEMAVSPELLYCSDFDSILGFEDRFKIHPIADGLIF